MADPSGPLNGQGRVIEGLVATDGTAGFKKGAGAAAVTGSSTVALNTVIEGTVAVSTNAELGVVTETAPATDTASSGLNGRLQRIAQRLTSLIALLPAALGAGGGLKVEGVDAALSTATARPIIVAGVYRSAPAAPTDGQLDFLRLTSGGALRTAFALGVSEMAMVAAQYLADGVTGAESGAVVPSSFNGSSYDRWRGNVEATLLASAARTATTNSPDQTNYNGRGVHVSLDVTVEGPATLAIKIQGKHSVGGTYYDIVDFGTVYTAASDAPGAKTVSLYPGIITADHVGVGAGVNGTIGKSAVLPRVWRAVVTHADATTCTYSLSAVTIL